MQKLGKELEFISFIKRDGTGVIMVGTEWNAKMNVPKTDSVDYLDNEIFTIKCLTKKTFIAHGFNSWVVKLKQTYKNE
jgi:hypothetical protein